MTKQAIIYARFSPRPNAAECQSVINQIARCGNYCDTKGYQSGADYKLGVFYDENISGGTIDRPGLQAALEALEPGMVLVVDSGDRLARDMLVYATVMHHITQAGATVEYANGSPIGTTPEATLMQNILASFSTYERDRVRFRTKAGLAIKWKNGARRGTVPIGYILDPDDPKCKKVTINKKETDAIQTICIMSQNGCSSSHIADYLTFHYGPCRGKSWSASTVRKIAKRHRREFAS